MFELLLKLTIGYFICWVIFGGWGFLLYTVILITLFVSDLFDLIDKKGEVPHSDLWS